MCWRSTGREITSCQEACNVDGFAIPLPAAVVWVKGEKDGENALVSVLATHSTAAPDGDSVPNPLPADSPSCIRRAVLTKPRGREIVFRQRLLWYLEQWKKKKKKKKKIRSHERVRTRGNDVGNDVNVTAQTLITVGTQGKNAI